MSDWSPNTVSVVLGVIGFLGILFGGGVLVELMRGRRTRAEAGDFVASAKVKQAEAESIAVTTLKTAVEEIRKIAEDKEKEISEVKTELAGVREAYVRESADREGRFQAEMNLVREELSSLRQDAQAARAAWDTHAQWDWNVYHWAKNQGMEFPEPPPMRWGK